MKKMMMIGNAHIDPVWLWQWREGYHEVKATFRSALDRLNEKEDFVFTCACADYYRWVEENEPEMFKEIRSRVREGRWVITGGMWIQPDMNTPSGESIARQLLYSQRYFMEKFGFCTNTGYNVDSFGHNAMLPQLLKKAGMENYVWMRPGIHENPEIPEGPMIWEAPDGSRVCAYRIFGEYTTAHNMPQKIDKVFSLADRIGRPVMCFYGVGNHGGGPTIENLREIDAYMKENPRGGELQYASPVDYFAQLPKDDLPVWKNELQHHASGCYSTHSRSKKLHREAEGALIRMEMLGALSRRLTGHRLKEAFVMQAWDDLMFNEFHDIMGGCCLREALNDTEMQLGEAIAIASREENAALQKIAWRIDTSKGNPLIMRSKEDDWKFWGVHGQGTPVVVFNPHAFDAEGEVLLRRPFRAVRDDTGNSVPAQVVRAGRTNGEKDRWDGVFRAKVPAVGWRLYWVFMEEGEAVPDTGLIAEKTLLENENIRAEFDPETGAIVHLIDKRSGFDALAGASSVKLMDIEHCDTWAHNIFRFDRQASAKIISVKADVLENGPVRAVLRVVTRFEHSRLEQRYILYASADQLEMDVRLDMHEHFRMLKLCFPANGTTDVSEIPYGVLERSANGDEQHCQRWVAMQGEAGGFALINDGKYSYSAQDGELRMTVSNTSLYADHYGQDFRDDTGEFMDQGVQRFRLALVSYGGSWQDALPHRRADLLNVEMPHIEETYHEGPLGGSYCGIEIDEPSVRVGAFKRAENDAGWVLRIAEAAGDSRKVRIDLKLIERSAAVELGRYEIKTLYFADDNPTVREILITETDL